jgi:hypothetical protein
LVLPGCPKDTGKSLLDLVEVGDGILIDWKLKLFVTEVGYSFVKFMTIPGKFQRNKGEF